MLYPIILYTLGLVPALYWMPSMKKEGLGPKLTVLLIAFWPLTAFGVLLTAAFTGIRLFARWAKRKVMVYLINRKLRQLSEKAWRSYSKALAKNNDLRR